MRVEGMETPSVSGATIPNEHVAAMGQFVGLGSIGWVLHGVLMLGAFFTAILGIGLTIAGDLSATLTAALTALIMYLVAVGMVLVGSAFYGLGFWRAGRMGTASATRAKVASILFFVNAALAATALASVAAAYLAATAGDILGAFASIVLILLAWATSSVVLLGAAVMAFGTVRRLRSEGVPTIKTVLLLVYAVLNLVGVLAVTGFFLPQVTSQIVPGYAAVGVLGAFLSFLVNPVVAIGFFAALLVQGMRLRKAAALPPAPPMAT